MTALITEVNEAAEYTFRTGDTSDFIYIRPLGLDGAVIDGNWSCSQVVKDLDENVVIAEAAVTTKSTDTTEFKCFLTPTQTANLQPSGKYQEYTWMIQLSNSTLTPPIVRETHIRIGVYRQGVS